MSVNIKEHVQYHCPALRVQPQNQPRRCSRTNKVQSLVLTNRLKQHVTAEDLLENVFWNIDNKCNPKSTAENFVQNYKATIIDDVDGYTSMYSPRVPKRKLIYEWKVQANRARASMSWPIVNRAINNTATSIFPHWHEWIRIEAIRFGSTGKVSQYTNVNVASCTTHDGATINSTADAMQRAYKLVHKLGQHEASVLYMKPPKRWQHSRCQWQGV